MNFAQAETTAHQIKQWLQENLHRFDSPAAYLGTEPGLRRRDAEECSYRAVLCIPTGYEESGANRAVSLFNQHINDGLEDVLLDLAYFPNTPRELRLIEKSGFGIFSLQRKWPLAAYDFIGFSIHQPLQFFAVVRMLAMSGIPVRAHERMADAPLVVFGGPAMLTPEPVWAVPDLVFIGEGDEALPVALAVCTEMKRNEWSVRPMMVEELAREPGFYVPGWYKENYRTDGMIEGRLPLERNAPERVVAQRLRNLDKVRVATQPFVRYVEDAALWGTGAIEVSRGCVHGCRFCQEGWTRRPYRERSIGFVSRAAEELTPHAGTHTFAPYAFNVGDYSSKCSLVRHILENVGDTIGQSSQRVEHWAEGGAYIDLLAIGGLRRVTWGVEGFSERLRRMLNKHITRAQFYAACQHAFDRNLLSIKLMYITSVPGEEESDYAEFQDDIRHVLRLRDKSGAKTALRCQFTQFQAEAHTPLQWAEVKPDARPLYPTMDFLREQGVDFNFGRGTGHTAANLLNILHRGDRRMCAPLIRLAEEDGYVYWEGAGKRDKKAVEQLSGYYMEQRHAHPNGLDYLNRERAPDEQFSWDFIDTGVPKPVLRAEYEQALQELESPVCRPIEARCRQCGACDTTDRTTLTKYRHQIKQEAEVSAAIKLKSIEPVQRARIRFFVEDSHRFLPRRAQQTVLRRVMMLEGLPVSSRNISLASDGVNWRNWTAGVDYADVYLAEKVFTTGHILNSIRRQADLFLMSDMVQFVGLDSRPVGHLADSVVYRMEYPQRGNKIAEAIKAYNQLPRGAALEVVRRRFGRGEVWRTKVDLTEHLFDLFWAQGALYFVMSPVVSVYDAFAAVFHSTWRNAVRWPARRIDFLQRRDRSMEDFFYPMCSCGNDVEVNLFDEPIGERCIRCLAEEGVFDGTDWSLREPRVQ